jgi:hypothetical protein
MQDANTGSFTNHSDDSATPSGGAPPPGRNTRYNTLTSPPPKFGAVKARLMRGAGRNGFARKDEVVAAIRTADRREYADSAAQDLFRFLEVYGAVYQHDNGRWFVEGLRFQELEIACENQKPLAYDFVVTTVPGAACGCPQGGAGLGSGKPAAKGGTPPANGGELEKPLVIRRLAYMSHLERHTLEVIDVFMQGTVVGEFRSPTHLDDDAFRASDFGKLFGWPRELFVAILDRFIAAGIIVVCPATGPDGAFDALVFRIPFTEIQIVEIIDRRPQAIPAIVMDLIVRTLDLEGLTSFKDGLTATVKKAMVDRLSRRGIVHGEKVVDVFAGRLFHFNEAQPENGWGLVLPGVRGADAAICLPGFAPVQFVEDSTFMKSLPRSVTIPAPAQEMPTTAVATPKVRALTLEDIQGLGDEALATHLADAEVLLAALQAEGPRREAERALVARRAELQARLEVARLEEAAKAPAEEAARREAERIAAEKAAARQEREALEAALAEL